MKLSNIDQVMMKSSPQEYVRKYQIETIFLQTISNTFFTIFIRHIKRLNLGVQNIQTKGRYFQRITMLGVLHSN